VGEPTFLIAIFGLFASASFIVWTIARTVLRMKQQQHAPLPSPDLEARLARIEAAVESIAIEVERNGELQRFNARLAKGDAPPVPFQVERPITPH
jgi:hypothetical protein